MALADLVSEIEALLARGEYLAAYDAVAPQLDRPLAAEEDDRDTWLRLRYLGALALARSGATSRSAEVLAEIRDVPVADLPPRLAEDLPALTARLVKDQALALPAGERSGPLAEAAALYETVHHQLGGTFAGVNAATLWFLAGERDRASVLAREVLDRLDRQPSGAADRYWVAVTAAEALLVLGDVAGARDSLERASESEFTDVGARATTRRQLGLLAEAIGLDHDDLLRSIANPAVVHYCGHRLGPPGQPGRLDHSDETAVRAGIDAWLEDHPVRFAHGSLASGADIIAAEALLDQGAALDVVLPCALEDFIRQSVAPAGPGWIARFNECLGRARRVTLTCDSAYGGDDNLFAHASMVSMGEAINRAGALQTDACQLAVWDGENPGLPAGTAHDMAVWAATGSTTYVIPVQGSGSIAASAADAELRREVRAVLFGDLTDFSRLRDEHFPAFARVVMGAVAGVLDEYGDHVDFRNTWGDGTLVVADGAAAAARIGLGIQDALADLDLAGAGLPPDLNIRLSGHVGPLLTLHDPILGTDSFMGRELVRAARIEPRTPPGQVYVTGSFAALLVLDPDHQVAAEYVGHVTTAKDFETIPMYVLRHR